MRGNKYSRVLFAFYRSKINDIDQKNTEFSVGYGTGISQLEVNLPTKIFTILRMYIMRKRIKADIFWIYYEYFIETVRSTFLPQTYIE